MEKRGFDVDLQTHFFRKRNYDLLDILKTMERKCLAGLGLLYYEWEETSLTMVGEIGGEIKENYKIERAEDNVTIFTNKKNGKKLSIILGEEVGVQNQRWHILAIGVTGIKSSTPEGIIEEILEKGGLPILDHPFADPQRKFGDIGKEKEEELVNLCQRYAGKIALEWNGYCLPWVRMLLPGYSDVNKKVEKLSKELNIPLIPTTDLHARNKRLLKAVGTCFIEIPSGSMDFRNLLSSLKENIFSFNFTPHKHYVSFWHFVEAFGVPLLMRL